MKQLIALLLFIPLLAGAILVFTPQEFATRLQQQGPERALKQTSPCEWQTLIAGVSEGNKAWLALVPEFAEKTNQQQGDELMDALSFALIKNPNMALDTIEKIDHLLEKRKDTNRYLLDRFSWLNICAITLDRNYNRESTLRYYQKVTEVLKPFNQKSTKCLKLLNEAMDEIKTEEQRGTMKWQGTKSWQP